MLFGIQVRLIMGLCLLAQFAQNRQQRQDSGLIESTVSIAIPRANQTIGLGTERMTIGTSAAVACIRISTTDANPMSIVVKLEPATVVMTGIEFLTYAQRYYDAAETLRDNSSNKWFDPIPYHLLGQSLELNLKAFIWMTDRLSRDKFKTKNGHDIEKLWRHAKARGVHKYCTVTSLRDKTVALVGPYYKDRKFAYLDLSMSWEGIPEIRKSTHILPTLRRHCKQSNKSLFRPVASVS